MTAPIYSCAAGPNDWLETKKPMSSKGLARLVFNELKKTGLLKDGVTPEMIESRCISDADHDGRPQVRLSGLTVFIKEDPGMPAFGTPQNSDVAIDKLRKSPLLSNYLEDRSPKEKDVEPSFDGKIKFGLRLSLTFKTPLKNTFGFFESIYNKHSMDGLNKYLAGYLRLFYVHSGDALSKNGCSWNVTANVTGQTSPEDFRTTEINGRRQAIIDCDIYAKIAFTILSAINGGKAFDLKLLVLKGKDPSKPPHAVLVFTETATNRTFVLDNNLITEVGPNSKHHSFVDYCNTNYPGLNIVEYKNIDDLEKNENGNLIYQSS